MKTLSLFRKTTRPSIHFVPASDFFNRLHDPRYRTLDELQAVAPSSSLPPAAQPHWQTLPPFQHYE